MKEYLRVFNKDEDSVSVVDVETKEDVEESGSYKGDIEIYTDYMTEDYNVDDSTYNTTVEDDG